MKSRILSCITALTLFGTLATPVRLTAQTFVSTGSMNFARTSHQATLLHNGDVLVSGGADSSAVAIAQAEFYTPSTGTWSVTGSNVISRYDHTATVLRDGRVLVVGGVSANTCSTNATAETYDPATGNWTLTGNLPSPVGTGHSAVLLLDGRVLVAGGGDRCGTVHKTASAFNPSTNTWTSTGSMAIDREFASAVRLFDGRVLIAGGVTDSPFPAVTNAETYDPHTGTWSSVGSMVTPRETSCNGYMQTYLATLCSREVLAAAAFFGTSCFSNSSPKAAAEIFNPGSLSWASVGAMNTPRGGTTLTVLPDQTILVAGGNDGSTLVSSAEIFHPTAGTPGVWTPTGSLNAPREDHTATRLVNGNVLMTGGVLGPSSTVTATAEIYRSPR